MPLVYCNNIRVRVSCFLYNTYKGDAETGILPVSHNWRTQQLTAGHATLTTTTTQNHR